MVTPLTANGRIPSANTAFARLAIAAVMLSLAAGMAAAAPPKIRTDADNAVPRCVTPKRLMAFLKTRNSNLDPRFADIAAYYKRHGEIWRVRWDYAFFQMAVETNFLTYRKGNGGWGDVNPKQNNFAGLGTTGGGVPGDSYPDVNTGVLAQIQHLVVYSGERIDEPVGRAHQAEARRYPRDRWRARRVARPLPTWRAAGPPTGTTAPRSSGWRTASASRSAMGPIRSRKPSRHRAKSREAHRRSGRRWRRRRTSAAPEVAPGEAAASQNRRGPPASTRRCARSGRRPTDQPSRSGKRGSRAGAERLRLTTTGAAPVPTRKPVAETAAVAEPVITEQIIQTGEETPPADAATRRRSADATGSGAGKQRGAPRPRPSSPTAEAPRSFAFAAAMNTRAAGAERHAESRGRGAHCRVVTASYGGKKILLVRSDGLRPRCASRC